MNADQIFTYGMWALIALGVLIGSYGPALRKRVLRCWCGQETDDLRTHHRERMRSAR